MNWRRCLWSLNGILVLALAGVWLVHQHQVDELARPALTLPLPQLSISLPSSFEASSTETDLHHLQEINDRLWVKGHLSSEANTDLDRWQRDLWTDLTAHPSLAENKVETLELCARDSHLLEAVRLVCAGNLKRLTLRGVASARPRFEALAGSLTDDEAAQLGQTVRE